MRTALVIGTIIAASVAATYVYLKYKETPKPQWLFLKDIFKTNSKYEVRETNSVSMRTFGAWIKEHDFPSFAGYKFFVIKDKDLVEPDKNPDNFFVHGFCVTDANFNVIDACIYISKEVDSSFAIKITEEVNEIIIK